MRERTVFVAGSWGEASYWMRQWGFGMEEATVVTPAARHRVHGMRITRPVFVCGSYPISPDLLWGLEVAGAATYIDAHDLCGVREPRSALCLLPFGGEQ